jgi:hypothetical protein
MGGKFRVDIRGRKQPFFFKDFFSSLRAPILNHVARMLSVDIPIFPQNENEFVA